MKIVGTHKITDGSGRVMGVMSASWINAEHSRLLVLVDTKELHAWAADVMKDDIAGGRVDLRLVGRMETERDALMAIFGANMHRMAERWVAGIRPASGTA